VEPLAVRITVKRFREKETLFPDNVYLYSMKGASTSSTTGTAILTGIASAVGTGTGSSVCNSWFPQTLPMVGTGTGSSTVAQVNRVLIDIPSNITLIAEYVSGI